MKLLKHTIIFLAAISSLVMAQGRIFQPKEAEALFGSTSIEKEISVDQLQTYLSYTNRKIMFGFVDGQLFILGDNRAAISPTNKFIGREVLVYAFGKSVVEEFLKTNMTANVIKVQVRGTALCLDNGLTVLEFAQPCPPYCD